MLSPTSRHRPFCRGTALLVLLAVLSCGQSRVRAQAATATSPPKEAVEAYQAAREHYKAGRYPAALKHLERARDLDPNSPDLLYNVARVYELMGELTQAVTFYEHYLNMLPVDEDHERQRIVETIDRLRGAQEYSSQEPPPIPAAPPAPRARRGVADVPFWTIAGVALGSLSAGGLSGALALSHESDVKDFVLGQDGTLDDRRAMHRKATRLALSSDVLLGAGAAATVAAVLLYALRTQAVDGRPGEPRDGIAVVPLASSHRLGMGLRGVF